MHNIIFKAEDPFETYFCRLCGSEILKGKICECPFSEEDEEEQIIQEDTEFCSLEELD